MIRANLLPRARERFSMFGARLDVEHVREASYGLAFVASVVALTLSVQHMRIVRVTDAIARANVVVLERAPQRMAARGDALELARYQEIEREALTFRRTGIDAAVTIADIGNRIPAGAWLDAIDRDATGYAVSGASQRVADVGRTMLAFKAPSSPMDAELVSIDGRGGDIRFEAHLSIHPGGTR